MFLESTLFFTKTEKFQKQCCPVLATQSRVIQVACYNRELAGWFWRLIREWKVQSREIHRDFHGSAHDSLSGRLSSREKHLKFFPQLCLWVFWWLTLATCFSHEKRVFCVSKTVFLKNFSFSLDFLWLFTVFPISLSIETDPNTPQTPFLHHLISRSSRKRYEFSLSCLIFHVSSIIFLIFELSLCFEIYCVWKFFCLD